MKLVNESVLKWQMPKTKAAWRLEMEQETLAEKQVKKALVEHKTLDELTKTTTISRLKLINLLLGDIKGKTILDIGCGAKQSWDYDLCITGKDRRYYDPWLCRVLQFCGAKTFGIDGGESPDEKYTHIQGNIHNFTMLTERFPNHSLDLACAWSFFDSPSLTMNQETFEVIVKRLEAKVKPNGFFIFEATGTGLYAKKDWNAYLRKRN